MAYSRDVQVLLLIFLVSSKLLFFEAFTTSFQTTRKSTTSSIPCNTIIDLQQTRVISMKLSSATESLSEVSHAFEGEDEAWDAYTLAIEEMLKSTRVLKKDKLEDLDEAKSALLSRRLLPLNNTASQLSSTAARDDWKKQAENYKEHYALTEPQFQFIKRALVYLGDYCARQRITAPIHVGWEKMKESGIVPPENAFSTYMYILGTECDDNACRDSLMEVAKLHDAFYQPNEKTITLQIKTLIAKNAVAEAEEMLFSLKVG